MSGRILTAGLAAMLVAAAPAQAQQRGTVEFGGFGSHTTWEGRLNMNDSWGGGARIGAFLHPRLSAEFEAGGGTSSRSQGLSDLNVGVVAARLTAVPLKIGSVSFLLGAGGDHQDNHFSDHTTSGQNYGVHALAGLKLALGDHMALRADGIQHFREWSPSTRSLHLGISLYRQPRGITRTITRTVQAPAVAQRPDSVSAAETRRLRNLEASYARLRDSLARTPAPVQPPPSSASALATMQQLIHFEHDRSALSDTARRILNEKVTVFRANPEMRIVIVGHTSQPGTAGYNMALGMRRAVAARDYLVAQGVAPVRIEIASRGQNQLLVEGPGEAADAANRRGQFRLQISDTSLPSPRQ